MRTYVALLRGINVGGKNKISMVELKALMEQSGYQNVHTYINSGNVIFQTETTSPRKLEIDIEAVISKGFTLPISVVVRSMSKMDDTINAIPKNWSDQATYRCYAIFLRHTIDKIEVLEQLGTPKPDVEQITYAPGVLFWTLRLDSLTKSGLNKLMGGTVYKDMTIRNQNTTRKIYDIMKTVDAK